MEVTPSQFWKGKGKMGVGAGYDSARIHQKQEASNSTQKIRSELET